MQQIPRIVCPFCHLTQPDRGQEHCLHCGKPWLRVDKKPRDNLPLTVCLFQFYRGKYANWNDRQNYDCVNCQRNDLNLQCKYWHPIKVNSADILDAVIT